MKEDQFYWSFSFVKIRVMRTIILLLLSNVFMTFGWYYHLKHTNWPIWIAILISWGFAFFEYCLQVPANRLGFTGGFTVFQLKIMQEVITLIVFCLFAIIILKQPFHTKYLISFLFMIGAVYFMFK